MREGNVHLPLAEIPEEIEIAEITVLLDYLRDNAALHQLSELREHALAAGYRASVVERAVEEFEKEPRPAPAPEPPPVRSESRKPLPMAPPAPPAPPPRRVPDLLDQSAQAQQAVHPEPAPAPQTVPAVMTTLIVLVNALVLSLVFTGSEDLAMAFYVSEFVLAFLLAGLQKLLSAQVVDSPERLASLVQTAAPVSPEPDRAAVPTLPHDVRTEAREAPGFPTRTPSRR